MARSDAGTARSTSSAQPSLLRRLTNPTASAVVGLGFVLWGVWLGSRPLADNSFFTHLATGRLILDNAAVPTADPYSFTAAGEPWVVQSWLASLIYGALDRWFGPAGIQLATGLVCATIAWLIWRLSRPAQGLVARVAIVGLAMSVGGAMWSPRPLLFGLVFLGLALLAAEGAVDPGWLLPAFWVWVNTHGSFPLGLVALALMAWGRKLDGKDPETEWRALLWALGGTALGVIGPLGPKVLLFPVELLSKSDVLQRIIEWQSPNFSIGWTRVFLLQIIVAVLALVRRPSWRGALPTVVFVAASLLGVRNVAVASIVLVPVMAHALAGLGSLTGKDRSPAFAVIGGAVVVVAVALLASALAKPAYDLRDFPVDAVAWLDQQGALRDPNLRMASQDTTGNYLELVRGKDARAFMDDRVDMYPKPVVDDLVSLLHGDRPWRQILDDRKVDIVLWERSQPLSQLLTESEDWRVVYEDARWMVACRRGTSVGSLSCGAPAA